VWFWVDYSFFFLFGLKYYSFWFEI
jgi:hypothetical protein